MTEPARHGPLTAFAAELLQPGDLALFNADSGANGLS
ncbi:hypothetical protein a10_06407 [Streptomyces acidiscabies]|nr:hypothetical protein a10_06407 [Streptomyces acidiscabies]GAV44074.1 hypothetical protein Saa2_07033 [Streptomyces acidiscabies]